MTNAPITPRHATAAIVGAGDFIGAAIARKFAAEGYKVYLGRRRGELLAPLVAEIEAAGGRAVACTLDARDEDQVTAFFAQMEADAPLELCVFNVGANVQFSLLDTTARVFRKVWEMAAFSGFLTAREATRHMLPRGHGSLFLPVPHHPSAAKKASPRFPPPSSRCARWRSPRRANLAPRGCMWRI